MINLISRERSSHQPRLRRLAPAGLGPIVLAAGLFAALVTGCSSNSDTKTATPAAVPTGALPDGAQLVKESAKTTQTLQSVHMALAIDNVPNLPVESVNADVTNQPVGSGQAIGDAKVRLKQDAPFTQTKFLVVDKILYAGDGVKYSPVGPAEKIYDPGVLLDKDKGLANVIGQVQNPKVEGREVIDGINVVKVTGTIDGVVIDPVVPKAGDGIGSLPITLWIADVAPPANSSASTLPSQSASPGTGPNLVRAVVNKDQGTIKLTLSAWAKPVNVVKPAG